MEEEGQCGTSWGEWFFVLRNKNDRARFRRKQVLETLEAILECVRDTEGEVFDEQKWGGNKQEDDENEETDEAVNCYNTEETEKDADEEDSSEEEQSEEDDNSEEDENASVMEARRRNLYRLGSRTLPFSARGHLFMHPIKDPIWLVIWGVGVH